MLQSTFRPGHLFLAFLASTLIVGCIPQGNGDALVANPAMHEHLELPMSIWIARDELAALPTTGAAWNRLKAAADRPLPAPDLSDQDSEANVLTLARALVFAKTGVPRYRDEVETACMLAMGTERGGNALALAKQLTAYIVAADLVGLSPERETRFRAWLRDVVDYRFPSGKSLRSTHEVRPNNWGTFAGAARLAAAVYLKDENEVKRCAEVFKGWLGDRSIYSGFKFKDRSWQARPRRPVGINPAGSAKHGHSIDGVLPDDQRRAGSFVWPPPRENYVYTALQGAVAQAVMLERCGYPAWKWEDRALLRAFKWLYEQADYPATGDDAWMIYLINRAYAAKFPEKPIVKLGKNLDWTDWTHE